MKSIFLFCLLLVILTSCNQPLSTTEILKHPKLLAKALLDCQSNPKSTLDCKAIENANEYFLSLCSQYRENPLSFALKIMEIQTRISTMQSKITALQKQIDHEKNSPGLANELQSTQKSYQQQQQQLDLLYAVVWQLRPV